jgi:hypothetical protein
MNHRLSRIGAVRAEGAAVVYEGSVLHVREADIVGDVAEGTLEALERGERAAVDLLSLIEEHEREAADHAVTGPHLLIRAAPASQQAQLRPIGKEHLFSASACLVAEG